MAIREILSENQFDIQPRNKKMSDDLFSSSRFAWYLILREGACIRGAMKDRMDKIFLEGLELACRVGYTEDERKLPQSLRVDIVLMCEDLSRAGKSDCLEDTVDYAIARALIASVQNCEFKLIERVADVLASCALSYAPVKSVTVTIRKRAPVESLAFAGVEITRTR